LPLITGEFAYVLGILTAILFCRNHNLTIKIDDMVIKKKTLLAAVGNGRYYGGGMLAVPEAVIDDGLFDVCHVEEMKRHSIFRLFPKFMKGLHGSLKEVHFYRGRSVEIAADKPIPMNLDGEVTLVDKVVFELFPKGLPFVFPAQ
jgi:diacylglycerol kinase family enzyme